jgi:cell division septation protein DedD
MGPKTARTLTYSLVAGCLFSLMFLVKKSAQQKKANTVDTVIPSSESALGKVDASTTTIGSPAAAASNVSTAPENMTTAPAGAAGSMASGTAPAHGANHSATAIPTTGTATTFSTSSKAPDAGRASDLNSKGVNDEVNVTMETPNTENLIAAPSSTASAKKVSAKSKVNSKKGGKAVAAKAKPKYTHTPGDKGDFMVLAGSFASKDNAEALCAKLKKMGYKFAETAKFENSGNTEVIVAKYPYKGGGDAVVKALKAKNVPAYVKKKSGDIYKKDAPAVAAPAAKK